MRLQLVPALGIFIALLAPPLAAGPFAPQDWRFRQEVVVTEAGGERDPGGGQQRHRARDRRQAVSGEQRLAPAHGPQHMSV